jgi:hypothetical protein
MGGHLSQPPKLRHACQSFSAGLLAGASMSVQSSLKLTKRHAARGGGGAMLTFNRRHEHNNSVAKPGTWRKCREWQWRNGTAAAVGDPPKEVRVPAQEGMADDEKNVVGCIGDCDRGPPLFGFIHGSG